MFQQLIDAVARQDIHNTILVLAYCTPDQVNAPYSATDTRRALHIAAALGNPNLVQLLIWVSIYSFTQKYTRLVCACLLN